MLMTSDGMTPMVGCGCGGAEGGKGLWVLRDSRCVDNVCRVRRSANWQLDPGAEFFLLYSCTEVVTMQLNVSSHEAPTAVATGTLQ
jgi:hypothetical protein